MDGVPRFLGWLAGWLAGGLTGSPSVCLSGRLLPSPTRVRTEDVRTAISVRPSVRPFAVPLSRHRAALTVRRPPHLFALGGGGGYEDDACTGVVVVVAVDCGVAIRKSGDR